MSEIWKPIKCLDCRYDVSSAGRIRSTSRIVRCKSNTTRNKRGIIRKTPLRSGYPSIGVVIDGKRRSFSVHRFVAQLFIPNPNNKPCVNHINGDKTDNRVENLEWVSYRENANHAISTGLIRCGDARLIDYESLALANKIAQVKSKLKWGVCMAISKRIGINQSMINAAACGKLKDHVLMVDILKEMRSELRAS